jgi:hypothetical protein
VEIREVSIRLHRTHQEKMHRKTLVANGVPMKPLFPTGRTTIRERRHRAVDPGRSRQCHQVLDGGPGRQDDAGTTALRRPQGLAVAA